MDVRWGGCELGWGGCEVGWGGWGGRGKISTYCSSMTVSDVM